MFGWHLRKKNPNFRISNDQQLRKQERGRGRERDRGRGRELLFRKSMVGKFESWIEQMKGKRINDYEVSSPLKDRKQNKLWLCVCVCVCVCLWLFSESSTFDTWGLLRIREFFERRERGRDRTGSELLDDVALDQRQCLSLFHSLTLYLCLCLFSHCSMSRFLIRLSVCGWYRQKQLETYQHLQKRQT